MRPLVHTLVAVATALASCATVGEERGPELAPRFPSHRYVLGTGEGDGVDEARQRAYASIAMQLRADLRATERVEAYWSDRGDGAETISQEIRVTTRFDRVGWIRTLEITSEGGRYRVLCLLDREMARADLDAEIEEDLGRLRLRLASAGPADSLGGLTRALRPMRSIGASLAPKLALRDTLAGRAGSAPEELRALRALEARFEALRRAQVLSLCLETKGTEGELVGAFGASIAASGWAVAPCGDGSLRLEGVLRAETVSHRQAGGYPWFCTTSVAYRLVDPATGRAELGGSRRGLRAGGMTPFDACRESLSRLAVDVASALEGVDL